MVMIQHMMAKTVFKICKNNLYSKRNTVYYKPTECNAQLVAR